MAKHKPDVAYEAWLRDVDDLMWGKAGVSYQDVADRPWRADNGVTAADAVDEALDDEFGGEMSVGMTDGYRGLIAQMAKLQQRDATTSKTFREMYDLAVNLAALQLATAQEARVLVSEHGPDLARALGVTERAIDQVDEDVDNAVADLRTTGPLPGGGFLISATDIIALAEPDDRP